MKLKTALELLGDDRSFSVCVCGDGQCEACTELTRQLELVARRAREEAFEMAIAAAHAIPCSMGGDIDANEVEAAIRALPTESTK